LKARKCLYRDWSPLQLSDKIKPIILPSFQSVTIASGLLTIFLHAIPQGGMIPSGDLQVDRLMQAPTARWVSLNSIRSPKVIYS
jgi:hypothetical protein